MLNICPSVFSGSHICKSFTYARVSRESDHFSSASRYRSFCSTAGPLFLDRRIPLLAPFVPMFRHLRSYTSFVLARMFPHEGGFHDREHSLKAFDAHTDNVTRAIPPHLLLVYDVAQGWGPLCQFLNVPVPDVPFPRVNDTAEFHSRVFWIRRSIDVVVVGVCLFVALQVSLASSFFPGAFLHEAAVVLAVSSLLMFFI